MTHPKTANDAMTWTLLTQGVSSARLELQQLRHHIDRALSLVEKSKQREHINKVAGDIIQAVPAKVDAVERSLDRTLYALSSLLEEVGRDSLSISDRALVDDALFHKRANRVARAYLKRANIPLGYPGGICHVVKRIDENVRNHVVKDKMQTEVQLGKKLDKGEEQTVYDTMSVPGVVPAPKAYPFFAKLILPAHAQYRADLRSVNEHEIRLGLKSFLKAFMDAKSRGDAKFSFWERAMRSGSPIEWVDPKLGLELVFKADPRGIVLITDYWKGVPDPRPGGCKI